MRLILSESKSLMMYNCGASHYNTKNFPVDVASMSAEPAGFSKASVYGVQPLNMRRAVPIIFLRHTCNDNRLVRVYQP